MRKWKKYIIIGLLAFVLFLVVSEVLVNFWKFGNNLFMCKDIWIDVVEKVW